MLTESAHVLTKYYQWLRQTVIMLTDFARALTALAQRGVSSVRFPRRHLGSALIPLYESNERSISGRFGWKVFFVRSPGPHVGFAEMLPGETNER